MLLRSKHRLEAFDMKLNSPKMLSDIKICYVSMFVIYMLMRLSMAQHVTQPRCKNPFINSETKIDLNFN